jgi:hypothetical protein
MDQNIQWNEAENYIYADRNPYIGPRRRCKRECLRDWGLNGRDTR